MAEQIGNGVERMSVFGGSALVMWTSAKAMPEHRKLDMMARQPVVPTLPNDPVLTELKDL